MRLAGIGTPWEVQTRDELRDAEGGPLMGYCNSEQRMILIKTNMHPHATTATLWHEWVHAMLSEVDVPVPEEIGEMVCSTLALALMNAGCTLPVLE